MILWLALACGSPEPEPAVQAAPGLQARTEDGSLRCDFRLDPQPPPMGELFAVLTEVRDARGRPVEGLEVVVDATMPDHGHGMLTRPLHREEGEGRYRSEGLKLHMAGRWVIEARLDEGRACRSTWMQPPGGP